MPTEMYRRRRPTLRKRKHTGRVKRSSPCAGKSISECQSSPFCSYARGESKQYCRMVGRGHIYKNFKLRPTNTTTKAQVYRIAKQLKIKGRSTMTKNQLIQAIRVSQTLYKYRR